MTRRMFDSGMWTNEHFGEMPMMARLLLLGIINHADDQGRTKAHLVFLRSQIFPYDDVSTDEIWECLQLIKANGTISLYEANGKEYIQLLNWWEYQTLQFATPSKYPAPNEWRDRLRFNGKGSVMYTHNWHKADGTLAPDNCDHAGVPLPAQQIAAKPAAETPPASNNDTTQVSTQVPIHLPSQVPIHLPRQDKEEDYDQDQDKKGEGDRASAQAPPRVVSSGVKGARAIPIDSPHLKDSNFVNGYIPPDAGRNAVEVYYERFQINLDNARLTAPQEDDLVRLCPDLDKLREVITSYSRTPFRLGNLQLILDWYRDGVPDKQQGRGPANRSTNNGLAAIMDYASSKGLFQ